MKKILFIVLCTLASCLSAYAQEDASYEAALDEAVALFCDKTVYLDGLENTYKTTYKDLFKNSVFSEENCHAMCVEIMDLMYPISVNMIKDKWSKTFSLEELNQIIAWWSSPVGQKMLHVPTNTGELFQLVLTDPTYQQRLTDIVGKYLR